MMDGKVGWVLQIEKDVLNVDELTARRLRPEPKRRTTEDEQSADLQRLDGRGGVGAMQDLHTLKKVVELQDVGLAHGQICGGDESMRG